MSWKRLNILPSITGPISMSIPQTFYNVIDNKLGKDDKNKRVNLKCQAFIGLIVQLLVGLFM